MNLARNLAKNWHYKSTALRYAMSDPKRPFPVSGDEIPTEAVPIPEPEKEKTPNYDDIVAFFKSLSYKEMLQQFTVVCDINVNITIRN
jgi:hypothetical protein